jgi:hypothetical protein
VTFSHMGPANCWLLRARVNFDHTTCIPVSRAEPLDYLNDEYVLVDLTARVPVLLSTSSAFHACMHASEAIAQISAEAAPLNRNYLSIMLFVNMETTQITAGTIVPQTKGRDWKKRRS